MLTVSIFDAMNVAAPEGRPGGDSVSIPGPVTKRMF